MLSFATLSYAERDYAVSQALQEELPTLSGPAPTAVMVARIARRLNAGSDAVAKHLLKLARTHPNATHTGMLRMRFGKQARGWEWHATPQPAGSVGIPKAKTPAQLSWDDMTLEERREWLAEHDPKTPVHKRVEVLSGGIPCLGCGHATNPGELKANDGMCSNCAS